MTTVSITNRITAAAHFEQEGLVALVIPSYVTSAQFLDVGIPGPPGTNEDVLINFSYGDATPQLIASLGAGDLVVSSQLVIEDAFNGIGASISIGTLGDPDAVFPSSGVLLSEEGIYIVDVSLVISIPTDLYLFITPGSAASAGSGFLFLSIN